MIRKNAWLSAIAVALCFGAPVRTSAQAQVPKHHHYKLVDLGTLGGPQSYNESIPPEIIINTRGVAAAYADTSIPDPFNPNCVPPGCFVIHAFLWHDGIRTELDSLQGGYSTFASSINARGETVGAAGNSEIDPLTGSPEFLAVLWKDGIINLGTLGGSQSVANAINDRGQVVGSALNAISDPFANSPLPCNGCGAFAQTYLFVPAATEAHAFLWRGGAMQDLGTLGGPDSTAVVVNDRGQIAGQSFINFIANASGVPTIDPFFWESGKMVDIGTLGGTFGFPTWLNKRGQVVGLSNLGGDQAYHAFLWDKKEGLKDLGTLGDYSVSSNANWINDSGEVVGESDSLTASRAFLWRNGVMINIGTVAGDTCSVANSINSQGQIVGFGAADCFNEDHAFLSEDGGPIVDLQSLVSSGSALTLIDAIFINAQGEIAARGKLINGDEHAVVLIPCDENHPDVEGCDYSLVEAAPETQLAPAQNILALAPTASTRANLPMANSAARARSTYVRHSRRPGPAPTSPK